MTYSKTICFHKYFTAYFLIDGNIEHSRLHSSLRANVI